MNNSIPLRSESILNACDKVAKNLLVLDVFDSLSSTNSWLLERPVKLGQAHLCITEEQPDGRGRRGNVWTSAANKNIMLSFGWSFPKWPEQLSGLSLMVGMLVAEQLNEEFALNVKVKWPNDLMVDDRKLGGILIELAGDPSGHCQVVIGLGLNVHQPDWSHGSSGYEWQDLQGLGVDLDRNVFVGQLACELISALRAFELHGFAPLVPAWSAYSSYEGKNIVVTEKGLTIDGKMDGVDEYGALLVLDESQQRHRFINSNVTARLKERGAK